MLNSIRPRSSFCLFLLISANFEYFLLFIFSSDNFRSLFSFSSYAIHILFVLVNFTIFSSILVDFRRFYSIFDDFRHFIIISTNFWLFVLFSRGHALLTEYTDFPRPFKKVERLYSNTKSYVPCITVK